jgi:hypothetical protein
MSLYFQDEHINTWPAEATAKTTNIGPTDILITFGSPTCNMAGLPNSFNFCRADSARFFPHAFEFGHRLERAAIEPAWADLEATACTAFFLCCY